MLMRFYRWFDGLTEPFRFFAMIGIVILPFIALVQLPMQLLPQPVGLYGAASALLLGVLLGMHRLYYITHKGLGDGPVVYIPKKKV